jgi:hypothetical protein
MSPSFKFRGFLRKLELLCSTLPAVPPVLRDETRSAAAHVQELLPAGGIPRGDGIEFRAERGEFQK